MMPLLSMDAGYCSKAVADMVNAANRGYLLALKNPQQELMREAKHHLGRRRRADAETSWEMYRGHRVRRLLYRTDQLRGANGWEHLRQVWRVRQETQDRVELRVEERYSLTNLPWGTTAGDIPLQLVRAHWGIENKGTWTMDTQWGEDHAPWTSGALEAVSLLRLLALNAVIRLRSRRFRSRINRQQRYNALLTCALELILTDQVCWGLGPDGG